MRWVGIALVVVYGLYCAALIWLHPRFIYPFSPEPFQNAAFQRHDIDQGPTLYAHDAGQDAPVVVYFMGNVGALGPFMPMLAHHIEQGRSVVAMGYRGGGGLPGQASEARLKADAVLAFDAVPDVIAKPGPVIVQGYSLGTGLALHVAARRSAQAVVLSAPYQRLCRLMASAAYVPACLLPAVQKWQSDKDAPAVDAPVMVLHGTEDRLIPIAEGQRLVAALRARAGGSTQAVDVIGAGHTNLMSVPSYVQDIDRFIETVTR